MGHNSEKGVSEQKQEEQDVSDKGASQVREVQVPQVTSQERDATKPKIVPVTKENRGMVSETHKGLIMNPNGTFTMTPQHNTWVQNPGIQIAKYHDTQVGFPPGINKRNHAQPSMLKLGFTFEGEWARIPRNRMDRGPNYTDFDIVRIEKYIDEEGDIRRAVCYGKENKELYVWFEFEEMMVTFPYWVIPNPTIYFNGKKFNPDVKKWQVKNDKKNDSVKATPRDQSKDIQGGQSKPRTQPRDKLGSTQRKQG